MCRAFRPVSGIQQGLYEFFFVVLLSELKTRLSIWLFNLPTCMFKHLKLVTYKSKFLVFLPPNSLLPKSPWSITIAHAKKLRFFFYYSSSFNPFIQQMNVTVGITLKMHPNLIILHYLTAFTLVQVSSVCNYPASATLVLLLLLSCRITCSTEELEWYTKNINGTLLLPYVASMPFHCS